MQLPHCNNSWMVCAHAKGSILPESHGSPRCEQGIHIYMVVLP